MIAKAVKDSCKEFIFTNIEKESVITEGSNSKLSYVYLIDHINLVINVPTPRLTKINQGCPHPLI